MQNPCNPVRVFNFHVKSALGSMPVTAESSPAPKRVTNHEEKANSWSNFHA